MTQSNPLKGYLRAQKPFDRKLVALLEVVAKSLTERIARVSGGTRFSDRVRAAQLRSALVEVRREQIRMFNQVGDIIRAGQIAASIEAIEQLGDVARVITASLSRAAAKEMIDSVLATSRAGIKNLYARTPRVLSSRLYDNAALTSGKIEDLIRAGIGSGLSARELARDIRRYVSPGVPGGVSYVTMRLARTEINNAFHNQQIAGMDAPGVIGAKWNLSGSHPRPDECNRLAQTDQYNMGVGVFPKTKVPGKPHPQCLCYLSYVTMDPDRFVSELRKGTFDDDLKRRYKANLELIKGGVPAPVKKTATKKVASPVVKKTAPAKKTAEKKTAPPAKKTTPVKAPRPVPSNAQPYHSHLKGIEDLADTVENSTITSVRRLTGGVSADTELVTYANGTKLVRKSAGNPGAEHAASVIGNALGLKVPRVYRNHPGEVFMDFKGEAKTAAELQARSTSAEWRKTLKQFSESDEGLKTGLFDLLIRNGDRNTGNWMIEGSRLIPIDHGHAMPVIIGGRAMPQLSASGPFVEQVFTGLGKNHRFTTVDIDWATKRILSVGQDLVHMGQGGFRDYALAVLEKLRPFAKGTRNILAGE